ncbi:hypothetical protein [Hymenobacter antarcticus]|uniref:WGR domain-containing protein n=1 Tax=Hymenobacter antarcticus TaxID=486270 RepID=A0ABP7QZZ3_9BACT
MNQFRITQTQPLTSALPYEVEECHRVWFLPWKVWHSLQERNFTGRGYRMAPRRFQTPQEAQAFAEHMLALRTCQEAAQARLLDEQRHRQLLPRVVQVVSPPMPA